MISKVRGMIKCTDMFYSSEMLRHDQEQQYRTVTGGLFSIAIIITTMIGFASMILETLDRSTITTQTQIIKNQDPTFSTFTASPNQNFMFAVQVWMVDVTGPQRYFDILFYHQISSGQTLINRTYLSLQPCTKQHWTSIPFLQNKFDNLNVGNWLCPPIGQNFQIYGKYSAHIYFKYVFQVASCNNQTDPSRPCASQEKIDGLFEDFSSQFYFTLYFTNPIINPSQKDYKSYYLQDQNYVVFGNSIGAQAFIYFTDYTINTDNSIWPFKDSAVDNGVLVQGLAINHPYQVVKGGNYATINFAKSTNSIKYTREAQKISSVFSFIGGMISAASALLFFIKTYTSFAFQISIAFSIFKPQKDSKNSANPKPQINFITFVQLHFYRICSRLGIKLKWPSIDYISECQEEITKQLDIKSVVKRFIFIEHCLMHIFEDFQIDGLQMKTPTSVQSIKLIREKCVCIIDEEEPNQLEQISKNSLQDNENISPQPSVCLQSNFELRKFPRHNYLKKFDCNVKGLKSQQISSPQLKRKTVNINLNAVKDDYKRERIRNHNLRLLSINSKMGNEISKKIWDSLQDQIKQTVNLNEIMEPRLIHSGMKISEKFN